MRVPTFVPQTDNPDALRAQLTKYQADVNQAFSFLGFEYAQTFAITSRPSEFPKMLYHSMPKPAWGLKHVYIRNLTSDIAVPTNDVFLDWIPESGGVNIRAVNGLTSTSLYEFHFIVYA